jgi:glycosidase
MGELWKKLFGLRSEHKSLSRGEMVRIAVSPDSSVYAFARAAGSDRAIVILNFSPFPEKVSLRFPMDRLFPGKKSASLKEIFSGAKLALDPPGLAELTLPGRTAWLLFPDVKKSK